MGVSFLGRRLIGAALAAVLGLTAAACGGGGDDERPTAIAQIPVDRMPPEILGLEVGQEDVAESVAGAGRVYVDAVGMFSLRRDDALQATVQVARFNDEAKWRDGRFRRSIVNGISSSRPSALQMGDHTVYLSSSVKQTIAVWFEDRYMWVMSAREEFELPRSLLRALVELEVVA